jgi:alpha-beta hydrolase superfamily lysophospholipase
LTGVILSSPALGPPRGVPSISQKILLNYNYDVNASFGKRTEQRTLAGTLYEQTRNIFFTPIFYLASLTRIPAESGWASEWVTDDPWEQIGFQVDPITLRENPLNFIYQVQEHMIEISWRMEGLSKPFLLFYPQGDQIVSPIGARRFAELAEENHHLNRVVSVGDSFAHELFRARPAVRDRLLGEMRDWLDAVLNQPSGS